MSETLHPLYQPLGPRQIRVLDLLPGIGGDKLTGNLTVVNLDGSPIFEALSYVWGSSERVHDMQISDLRAGITASLFSALTRIRLPDEPWVLWIDALCINQDDVQEKETQIPLMGDIFGSASCVIADLGEASKDSDTALDLLDRYWRTAVARGGLGLVFGRHLSPHETAMFMGMPQEVADACWVPEKLPDKDSEQWHALSRLAQRPWFSRVWIVQEFVLARDVIFYCGIRAVSWSVLHTLAFEYEDSDLPNIPPITDVDDCSSRVIHLDVLFRHRALCMLQRSLEGQALLETLPLPLRMSSLRSASLIDLLRCYQYSNSTIDRDRYYALAGLASNLPLFDQQVFRPDYTTDDATWNLRMCKYLLGLPQGREMFMFSGLSLQADLSLPSWTQTFGTSRKPGIICSLSDIDITIAAGGDSSLFSVGEAPDHTDAICLAGHQIDVIRDSFQTALLPDTTSTSIHPLVLRMQGYVYLAIDTFLSVLQPDHRTETCSLTIERGLLEAIMTAVLANTNTQANAWLLTRTLDDILPNLCQYLDSPKGPLKDCTRCKAALAEMLLDEDGCDNTSDPPPSDLSDSILVEAHSRDDDQDRKNTHVNGDEQGVDSLVDSGATAESLGALLGCAILPVITRVVPSTTVAGRYAGVPSDTETGDEIWIIAGCRLPAVVRRSMERPGMYRLVGFCYLDGILNNAALLKVDWSQKLILY